MLSSRFTRRSCALGQTSSSELAASTERSVPCSVPICRTQLTSDAIQDVNKVDLSDVEGDVLKLLLQYLYQGEYDPRLTDGKRSKDAPVYNYTGDRKHGYSYNFPHSCEQEGFSKRYNRSCNERFLCSHHICGDDCRYDCKNFVCETCCPDFGTPTPAAGGDEQLLLHAKMYDIGDKYTVTGLQQLAREKFLRACVSCWDSEYFATAAQYAFTTTPDEDKGLRDLISNTISQHMVLLKKPAVEALLNEFNGLAVGLLKAHGKTLGWV